MRQLQIMYKDEKAGQLIQEDDGSFVFAYDAEWLNDQSKPSISLTRLGTYFHYFTICFQRVLIGKLYVNYNLDQKTKKSYLQQYQGRLKRLIKGN